MESKEKNNEKVNGEPTTTDFEDAVCATECTGLFQNIPLDETAKESYGKVFDYGPEASDKQDENTPVNGKKRDGVSETHRRKG